MLKRIQEHLLKPLSWKMMLPLLYCAANKSFCSRKRYYLYLLRLPAIWIPLKRSSTKKVINVSAHKSVEHKKSHDWWRTVSKQCGQEQWMSQLWPVWSDDQDPELSAPPLSFSVHRNYNITLERRTARWIVLLKAERWSKVWIQNIQFSFSFRYYNVRFSTRQYIWGWLSGRKKRKSKR